MKTEFIRTLYGNLTDKIKAEIEYSIKNDIEKFDFKFICYTYGEENHRFLVDHGVCSIMKSKENLIFPYEHSLRHKLESYKYAAEDFDEFVHVDWDCNLKSKISDNIFNEMRKKGEMQACLYKWRRLVGKWRASVKDREDIKCFANSSFLYIRNRVLPQEAIRIYDNDKLYLNRWKKQNDEMVISYLFDQLSGGWQGLEYWMKNFESEYSMQGLAPVFLNKPNAIFYHDQNKW